MVRTILAASAALMACLNAATAGAERVVLVHDARELVEAVQDAGEIYRTSPPARWRPHPETRHANILKILELHPNFHSLP